MQKIDPTLLTLDVRKIAVFLSVMETKSFARTAEELFLTASGVSKTIHRLEETLDLPLFTRSTRNIIPTTYAELLYPAWKNALECLGSSYEEVTTLYETNTNTLNVAIPITSNPHLFIWPRTQNFLMEHEKVSLNLTSEPFDVLLNKTLQGMYDVAFLPHFDIKTLEEYHFCWAYGAKAPAEAVVPVGNALCEKESLIVKDLLDEELITFTSSVTPNHLDWLCDLWKEYGKTPKIGMESSNPFIMHTFDNSQNMVVIGDHFFIFPESEDVRRIPIRDFDNGIVMAWHPELKKPCALEYIEYMKV